MRSLFLAAGIAALLGVPAKAEVVERATIGPWTMTANYNNGSFGNCSIESSYGPKARVTFMVTNQGAFGVGVQNSDWNLNAGARSKASYRVDNGPLRERVATAASAKVFLMLLDADSGPVFTELRNGNLMFLTFDQSTYRLTLKGTKSALTELARCYGKHK